MTAQILSLAAVRRGRLAAASAAEPADPARAAAAGDYVRRAEESLVLMRGLDEPGDKAAVQGIAETWLALAEAELAKPRR
jgi:hypothetical protein